MLGNEDSSFQWISDSTKAQLAAQWYYGVIGQTRHVFLDCFTEFPPSVIADL